MNQLIDGWRKQGIKGKALTEKIQSTMGINGLPVKFDNYLRSPVMVQQASADEMGTAQRVDPQSMGVKVQVFRKNRKGKMDWEATTMKLSDLAKLPKDKLKEYKLLGESGDEPFDESTQKEYQQLLQTKNANNLIEQIIAKTKIDLYFGFYVKALQYKIKNFNTLVKIF
jgi:hypothetical protein